MKLSLTSYVVIGTVLQLGTSANAHGAGVSFYSVTPCRILDTRSEAGPFGGPEMASGVTRNVHLSGQCGIPPEATAVIANLTAVSPTSNGHLTAYPGGGVLPNASTINFGPGQTRTNNAIIPLALDGTGTVDVRSFLFPTGSVHLVLDVTGYFAPDPLTTLNSTSPSDREEGVALSRESILRFSAPIDPQTANASSIRVEIGDQPLDPRIYVSADRRSITLFQVDPLPAAATVRVTIDGSLLRDARGINVDSDADGSEGGAKTFSFTTVDPATIPGTIVCGRVVASEVAADDTGNSVDRPLEGATISVDGFESLMRATTDANGNFCLNPAPASRFFVHIDGRTATNGIPVGGYYPTVGKAWEPDPGALVNIGTAYLPLVVPGTLQPVSPTTPTVIHFPPAVLALFPGFSDVKITVPPGALFYDDGAAGGMAGIAPVPPNRIPGRLPPGLEFPIVITVQTDGATNFDPPAPVCFPNLPDPVTQSLLQPGEKSALWSFNHDAGRWETAGMMTVSPDGTLVCTDPGVGLRAPGWHGARPGSSGSGGGAGDDGGSCPGCENDVRDLAGEAAGCIFSTAHDQMADAANKWLGFGIPVVQCMAAIGGFIGTVDTNCGTSVSGLCNWGSVVWNAATTGLACYPGPMSALLGYAASVAECGYDIYQAKQHLDACHGLTCPPESLRLSARTLDRSRVSAIPVSIFAEQQALADVSTDLFDAVNGNPKWSQVGYFQVEGFSDRFSESMQSGSPGGLAITSSEKADLLSFPLPAPLTTADASALIDRFNLISAGQLPPTERSEIGQRALDVIETSAELQSRGWQTLWDGFLRGPAVVGSIIAERPQSKRLFYWLRNQSNDTDLRGRLGTGGVLEGLALRSRNFYQLSYLDPQTLGTGVTGFYSGPDGTNLEVPRVAIGPSRSPDSDGDGLSDEGEVILGTRLDVADTDGDGLADGAEVLAGSDPFGRNISIDEVVTGTISSPGEIDRFSFFANAGQTVFFDLQSGGNFGSEWRLLDELGRQVFRASFSGDYGLVTLTQGGAYFLTVGAETSTWIGGYQFRIWNVPPPDTFTISIGDIVSDGVPGPGAGRIESPGHSDVYSFSASPGQVVYFDFLSGGSLAIDWTLRDETGAQVFTYPFPQDFGNVTLTRGGTYRLDIGRRDRDFVGTYSFRLWDVPPPDTFAISIGDVVSDGVPGPGAGRIESPGVKDIYLFLASAGQSVTFDLQSGGTISLDWKLTDPSGLVIFNRPFFGDTGPYTLSSAGMYRLTIGSDQHDRTGIYQFRVTSP